MSIDRRLRDELERDAARVSVDVERNLGAVEARSRHRGPALAPLLAGAALIVAILVIRFGPTDTVGGPSPQPSAAASANPYEPIAGIYRATLESSGESAIDGSWTMELRANGTIVLAPPPSFSYGSVAPSGISYAIDGDRLRTDMFYNDFCSAVGVYTWALRGESLTLTPATEPCALRRALLGTSPWTKLQQPD